VRLLDLVERELGSDERLQRAREPPGEPHGGAGLRLVVNGDDDTMLPTISSFHLAQLLPDVQLSVYPDSGHAGIFQHHDVFVAQALDFLRD